MSSDLRVVLACNFPRDERLGSARVPLRLARELEGLGVEVVSLFDDDLPRVRGGRVQEISSPFRMAAALRRAAARADVVDIAGMDAWVYARFARRFRSGQAVVSRSNGLWRRSLAVHGEVARTPLRRALSGLYQEHVLCRWERASIAGCDLALFGARADADEVVRAGWKRPDEVAVVAPGVDDVFESQVPLGARRDVAFVGSLIHRKGSDVVCAAMSRVMGARADLGLTLLGPGMPAPDALALFDAAIRARVTVVETLPAAELAARLGNFAVLAFPSRYEGFGLVVLEAMRAGLAVVVTPTGAGADVVKDGENGLVVPIADVAATAAAISRLIDDAALRARLATAGREEARRRSWARTARELRDVYERARAVEARRP